MNYWLPIQGISRYLSGDLGFQMALRKQLTRAGEKTVLIRYLQLVNLHKYRSQCCHTGKVLAFARLKTVLSVK